MKASTIMERLEQMRDGIKAREGSAKGEWREQVMGHLSDPPSHRDCFNPDTGECSHPLCQVSDAPGMVDRDKGPGLRVVR